MTLDHGLRDRIALLRFVMIFGVIMLHTPQYVPMAEIGNGWFDATKAFFQLAVFRATVPVLTVISGFLLFGAALDRAPARLFSKKARTILLPFLCFNLPLVPLALGAQLFAGVEMSAQLWPFEPMAWLNAAFGLTASPINYPLNFLRDLLVLILLAPAFGWLLRNYAWPGLVLVSVVFFKNYDGALVLRDLMAVLFYVGGMAAVRGWNLRLLDRHALLCFLLFLLACAAIVHFRVANTTYLRLVAPFLIWPATAWLATTRLGPWLVGMSKYSFFMFLAHAPVLLLTWLMYSRYGSALPYPLYWVMAPVLVTAILVAVYRIANVLMPRLFPVLIGAGRRAAPPAPAAGAMPVADAPQAAGAKL
ncbi:acyltransferase family protein [Massilia timonae]|uniref:acyltransferase family protein n=1 Tax=Massilia timonae TaxID=47229 RepID=UPI0028D2B2A4|nr:acyltransferase family protein [Massilia timonae]